MKYFKKITDLLKWLQIAAAIGLTFMMMKAMKLMFVFFKQEGLF